MTNSAVRRASGNAASATVASSANGNSPSTTGIPSCIVVGSLCWSAPHDLPIGAKTWDAIDDAIRVRDKLLLILSKASIASELVEDEVTKAYAEERSRTEVVLFPIRIDNTVISTSEPWAGKLQDQRNVGDFRQWKKPARYQKSLEPCASLPARAAWPRPRTPRQLPAFRYRKEKSSERRTVCWREPDSNYRSRRKGRLF